MLAAEIESPEPKAPMTRPTHRRSRRLRAPDARRPASMGDENHQRALRMLLPLGSGRAAHGPRPTPAYPWPQARASGLGDARGSAAPATPLAVSIAVTSAGVEQAAGDRG